MITSEAGPFAIVPTWLLAKGLQPAAILTYIALSSFANADTGQAHPKQQQIADRAGLKLDTVNRALGALESAGIIDREKWYTTSGDIGGCHYRIRVVDPSPPPEEVGVGVPDEHPVPLPDHRPVPTGSGAGTYRTTVHNKKQTNKQTNQQTPSVSVTPATSKRGTRIPADFAVTDHMKEWARDKAPYAGTRDHETFMDYWFSVPGARGVKADWVAVWRNWMRKASDDRAGGRIPNARRGTAQPQNRFHNPQPTLLDDSDDPFPVASRSSDSDYDEAATP